MRWISRNDEQDVEPLPACSCCETRGGMALLTIAIPTWNRRAKLERLLQALDLQLNELTVRGRVHVLVSDNASDDGTSKLLENFQRIRPDFPLEVHRQPSNLGALRNVAWLYDNGSTEYLWLFADDDLPLPGAVARVLSVLDQETPRVLIASFVQPPGSPKQTFDFPEPVRLVSDPAECARLLVRGAKLSVFVYRRVPITLSSQAFLKATVDENKGGFYHCIIAVSLLEAGEDGRLAVLSEPIVTCDEDYRVIRTPVSDWGQLGRVYEHPYLVRRAPELAQELSPRICYLGEISILWAWRSGCLDIDASYRDEYESAARRLHVKPLWLLNEPHMLVRAMALRFLPVGAPKTIYSLVQSIKGVVSAGKR